MNKKKSRVLILLITIGVVMCLSILIYRYHSIFSDTNSLIDYVESIFMGEVSSEEVADTWFSSFDIRKDREDMQQLQVELDIKRVFVWHDFKEGYMWVKIDCEARNSEGRVKYGTINYERWDIKKRDGKWDIISIKEKTP